MPKTIVGFDAPATFPDFTKCDQTTPEFNRDYKAVIRHGGPARGFVQIMPSFSELLTPEQMNAVIETLRSFCTDKSWSRGELNFSASAENGEGLSRRRDCADEHYERAGRAGHFK